MLPVLAWGFTFHVMPSLRNKEYFIGCVSWTFKVFVLNRCYKNTFSSALNLSVQGQGACATKGRYKHEGMTCGVFLSTMGGLSAFDLQTVSADADASAWSGLSSALTGPQRYTESLWARRAAGFPLARLGGVATVETLSHSHSAAKLAWLSLQMCPSWMGLAVLQPRRAGGELRLWGVKRRDRRDDGWRCTCDCVGAQLTQVWSGSPSPKMTRSRAPAGGGEAKPTRKPTLPCQISVPGQNQCPTLRQLQLSPDIFVGWSRGFSAEAVKIKTDMTSDLLSVYFCLALLFFSTLLFSILVKGWALQTSNTENSRCSWYVRSDCEEWSVIQLYQPCQTSESLLCFLQMLKLPWGLYLSYRSKSVIYFSPERLKWPPWER